MKRVKFITAIAALLITSLSFASIDNTEVKKDLHKQIVSILGEFSDTISSDTLQAQVTFTLNKESEIVILSVDSNDSRVENYVKHRLNYKRVKVKALNEGKVYHIPLTIVNK